MILHLIIKNFGRVESADISLNNLVIFVGNNNSGKTMIMQLLYGIRKYLEHFPVPVSGVKQSELNGQKLIRCDRAWFNEVESQVNRHLAENKEQIVEDIFGSAISAEKIKIRLEEVKPTYFVSSISSYHNWNTGKQKDGISIDIGQYEDKCLKGSFESQLSDWNYSDDEVVKETLKAVWRIILSEKNTLNSRQLFLPASRSGLQLLYKHYFAGEAEGNLVMPIKDFLRFLQLYSEDKQLHESRRELLEFGEKHLLQGRLVQEGEETFYIDGYGDRDRAIPLYIASSMIHELTPFMKALSATQQIDWLYCDEVENSLHPLLQREMARWLIRMANAGMHVIVSSHSDTMASRLNNLFMLTQLVRRKADYKMLSELGLMNADILNSDVEAGIYEFRNSKRGKTEIEKLEFINHPLIGYNFELFGENLDKLYNEADKITR